MTTLKQIAAQVRQRRRAREWRQAELAAAMVEHGFTKWNRSIVANLESGRRSFVSVDELAALAEIFETSTDELMTEPDDQQWRHAVVADAYAVQLGKRVLDARHAANLTQAELAKLLDTTEESLCRWEHGRNEMAARWLPLIAAATGADPGWLLTGTTARGDLAHIRRAMTALDSVHDVLRGMLP